MFFVPGVVMIYIYKQSCGYFSSIIVSTLKTILVEGQLHCLHKHKVNYIDEPTVSYHYSQNIVVTQC